MPYNETLGSTKKGEYGPFGTLISDNAEQLYVVAKEDVAQWYASSMECSSWDVYPTAMDKEPSINDIRKVKIVGI